jgi:hypothetical protein
VDLNTVDWSRVCGAVAYSGGLQICTLAPHSEDVEHFWTPSERVPDALTPCQASKMIGGVLYLCGLYGRHVNRDHEWVRPSELRPSQIKRARPNEPGPTGKPVRHPTAENPLCLEPNPIGNGTVCALPPDHGLSGHGHYYVRLGGPGPGATPSTDPPYRPEGEPPEAGPLGRPPARPDGEYDSTRDRDTPAPSTPTTGGAGMASVSEVKAIIDAITQEINQAQQAAFHAAELAKDERLRTLGVLDASDHPSGRNAVAAMSVALENLNDAVSNLGNSITLLQEYRAVI